MRTPIYTGKFTEIYSLIGKTRITLLLKGFLLLAILCALPVFEAKAQDKFDPEKEGTPFVYDEIPVLVIVDGYNNFYVDVIYTNRDSLYVNIEDLFKTLDILCIAGQKGDSLGGFIENERQPYVIDYNKKQIKVGDKLFNSQHQLVKQMGSLYLESSLFAQAFGIKLTFNYRALSIILKSNFELPVIKQMRMEKLRNNLSKVKGELIADTVLLRNYHLFKFGTMDWGVGSFQTSNTSINNHVRLGLGTELLYGEADVSVDYYSQQKFDKRQLQYLWRWVDNDKSIIKQAQVGTIYTQSIAFINSQVIGAVVRNSPTTLRKANGFYTINEVTEPNWTVDLYINNILVDYTKADASGSFMFKVPIVYGYTTLKLKFYGPMGEEHTEERTMNVPHSIMPVNEFEYGITAGIVQDSSLSRLGKVEFNYGVDRILTVGGGVEYLSSIYNGPFIPNINATLQPFSRMTLYGEYAHSVRRSGILSYYVGQDALLEIEYTKYEEGQRATLFNAPEERKVKLSLPFRYKKITGFVKLDYTQLIYSEFYYNQANMMLSSYYKQFSVNSSTQLNWIDRKTPYVNTDLSLSYRLKNGYAFRSSAQYNVSAGTLITYKAELEKRIHNGYFSISYAGNSLYNDNLISLNFKYDLPFVRTNFSTTHSRGNYTTSESAEGSLAFGSGNNNIHVSNNSSVSKGGISLYPFLDLNQNGVFDKGEQMVKLNSVSITGGKAIFSEKDSIVRIPDLNAFTNYVVEFNANDLENIAWRFKNIRYQVLIDPNQFKRIDIPIIPVGEVSGTVNMKNENSSTGIGRILVDFYKKNDSKLIAQTLSEFDGYLYFLGLQPGDYIARIDSSQLNNLDFTADPPQVEFTIKALQNGDIFDGLDFVLSPKQTEKPIKEAVDPKK